MERFKGVNEISIESGDMEDLLKKNEYLDIRDYIEGVNSRQQEAERRSAELAAKTSRRRGG